MIKVFIIAGTRPELIRLSLIITKLDKLADVKLIFTNQNFDYNLSGKFFDELKIREPDYTFNESSTSFGAFLSNALMEFEQVLLKEKPDKILILGDTNSGLLSILADRYKIPVYHCEAGNRCYDKRVPEETNRRIIDHLSTYNLPYTENSKQNLINEGFDKNHVLKIGNPIYEVLTKHVGPIYHSAVLDTLSLDIRKYVLVTAHRAENVDNVESLTSIVNALNVIAETTPVVFSIHPRTMVKLEYFKLKLNKDIVVHKPFGLFDFVKLEQLAAMVITDSGTVQEEACIFGVPAIVIRNSTERQELIECGSSVLVGTDDKAILDVYNIMSKRKIKWAVPADYMIENVSDIVINILLGRD